MPIPVTCSCGKSIAAPSKFAGKKVKCPSCKQPLVVPSKNGKSASGKGKSSANGSSSSIRASCSCGKSFKAPAKAAGKKVRCPACKQPVKIPGSKKSAAKVGVAASKSAADEGVGSLLDEVGFQRAGGSGRCPECKEDLMEDAILCVACGYNLETGKMIRSKVKQADEEEEDDGVAPDHVASAEPGKKGGSKMILLLVLLLGLAGAVAFRMGLIPGL